MEALNESNEDDHIPEIKCSRITANWWNLFSERKDNTLTDVSFQVGSGQLLTVVGQIGSGKVSCNR